MTISLGQLGEQLVAQWLESQDYQILHYRWRCRWGELDLIAQQEKTTTLVFVEVKTRSHYNWDSNGKEAIALNKQQNISRSSALFLAKNPQFSDFYCRFDVALVSYQPKTHQNLESQLLCTINNRNNNDILILQEYLENAFEFCD